MKQGNLISVYHCNKSSVYLLNKIRCRSQREHWQLMLCFATCSIKFTIITKIKSVHFLNDRIVTTVWLLHGLTALYYHLNYFNSKLNLTYGKEAMVNRITNPKLIILNFNFCLKLYSWHSALLIKVSDSFIDSELTIIYSVNIYVRTGRDGYRP